jgi:transposase
MTFDRGRKPTSEDLVRLTSHTPYRFYNRSLKHVYDACPLTTEQSPEDFAPTTQGEVLRTWKHTTLRSPEDLETLGADLNFALPFLSHVPAAKNEPQTGKRKLDGKVIPFKRKEPLKGRLRSYKIRMLPTKEQLVELKRCFHACRVAFNFANKRVRDDKAPAHFFTLAREWTQYKKPEEIKGVAKRLTDNAVKDLTDAYKSNYAKLRRDPTHTFQINDRSQDKTRTEVIHMNREGSLLGVVPINLESKRRAECGLLFGNNLRQHGVIKIQGNQKVINMIVSVGVNLHAEARIQWDKEFNVFYFIWIHDQPVPQDPDPTFQNKRIVALDPGTAPFQQWYSPTSGEYGELLVGARDIIKEKCDKIDELRRRINRRKTHKSEGLGPTKRSQTFSKKKQKNKRQRTTRALKRKLKREYQRLSRTTKAAHYDAANFLLRKHDIIIAPILETGKLSKKGSSTRMGSNLARSLYTWGHRLFRQRLACAAARYPGRYVFECCEPGTSKTCTNCGAWKHDLRLCDKVYDCPVCKKSVNRQLAGARNNFFAAYGMAVGVGWDGVQG